MSDTQTLQLLIKAKNETDAVFKQVQGSASKLQSNILAMASGFVTAGAAVKLATGALKAQAEQEDAINKLNLALANQGNLLGDTSASLQAYAAEIQRATTFSDDAVIAGQAILASFGMNEEQIKRTTAAAADFAAATGTDLRTAIDILGKAYAGNTTLLGRYGIVVDENLTKSQKFDAAIDQLARRFGGAAAAATETYTGSLLQAKNAMNEAQEGLGKLIGQVLGAEKPFAGLIDIGNALAKLFGQDMVIALGEARAVFAETTAAAAELLASLFEQLGKLPIIGKQYKEQAEFLRIYAADLTRTAVAMREQSNQAAVAAGKIQTFTNATKLGTVAVRESAEALKAFEKNAEMVAKVNAEMAEQLNKDVIDGLNAYIQNYGEVRKTEAEIDKQLWEEKKKVWKEGAKAIEEAWKNLFAILDQMEKNEREAQERRLEHWRDLADLFATINQTLQVFGVTAESALGKLAQGLEDGLKAAEAYVAAQNNMQRAMAVMGAAQSAYASGSVLGGAATGAALGFQVGGPIGAGIGAIAGGLLGLFGAAKKAREELKRLREEGMKTFEDLKRQIADLKMDFLTKGVAGLAAMFKYAGSQADVTAARLDRLGTIGFAMFEALRQQGLTMVEALKAMGPAIDQAIAAYEKAGLEASGAFAALIDFRNKILANEDLVNAIDGWTAAFDALNATGNLTAEMFAALVAELANYRKGLEDAGFTQEQITAMTLPMLYRLYLAHKRYGFAVDEATQALFDQHEASGAFDDMKDPMEKLVELQELMLQAVVALVRAFGKDLPAAVQKYIDKLNRVPTLPPPPGGSDGGDNGDNGDGEGPPETAEGGWFPFRPGGYIRRIGEAGDEAVVPMDKLDAIVGRAIAAAMASGAGGGGVLNISLPINVMGSKVDQVWIRRNRAGLITVSQDSIR